MMVVWFDGSMVPFHTYLEPVSPGHVFVVHDPAKAKRKELGIKANVGESEHNIIINDEEEDELLEFIRLI